MNPDQKREFYKSLRERIHQLRMDHLFEEPCPLYEPEWEEDHYWDCRLTYDYEDEETLNEVRLKHYGCNTRLLIQRSRLSKILGA